MDDKDVNPDSTRPYSWEWATHDQWPPLEVGNCYDVVAVGSDVVCNEDSVWSAWNAGRGVTSGVYVYRLDVGGTALTRKMILLR